MPAAALARAAAALALLAGVTLARGRFAAWEAWLVGGCAALSAALALARGGRWRAHAALPPAAALLARAALYALQPAPRSPRFSLALVIAALVALLLVTVPAGARSRLARWTARAALPALVVALAFLLGELTVGRLARSDFYAIRPLPESPAAEVYRDDPLLGHAHAPGFVGAFAHPEFGGERFAVNADGYRGAPWPAAPMDGEARLLLLGDSMTLGLGVELEDSPGPLLEARLRAARPAARVRVLNASVAGYGPLHYPHVLERAAERARPTAVLVPFYDGNDLQEALEQHRRERALGRRAGPLRFEAQGWRPPPEHSLRPGAPRLFEAEYWRRSSSFYVWLQSELEPRLGIAPPHPPYNALLLRSMRLAPDVQVRDLLDLTAEALRALAERCAELGVPLLVARLPSKLQAEPRSLAALLAELGQDPADYARERPGSEILAAAAELGLPTLDLLPALEHDAPGSNPLFWYEGHPNRRGNVALADALSEWLLALGFPPDGR